ncbi:MAG TPA: glycosyltransferase family 4 protein [Alphaproteobacteria bacterium]|nr:glycosyltransferase family 4 protein [Alphaproteobacteria bacterium]
MKIAVLAAHLPSPGRPKDGGVAYTAHHLANRLAMRGHDIVVYSLDPRPFDASYAVRTLSVGVPARGAGRWLAYWRLAWALGQVDFSAFDAIHAHGNSLFVRPRGRPLVRTLHGAALAEARHAPSWRSKAYYLSFAVSELVEAHRATSAVAASHATRRYFPFVRRVVPLGIDLACFHPDGARSPRPSILFVGTLRGRKGGDKLVQAFERVVRPALPEAELWLVSEAPADAPGTRYFNKPATTALAELYRRAWVFCLPSAYEGFGLPYVEALASGTPVVATPNDGACEIMANGRYGVLTDVEALGPALLDLLRDPQRRAELAVCGLSRAQDFDLNRVVAEYEALFREGPMRMPGRRGCIA